MKLRFNKRWWWHFKNNREISFEIAGMNSHPSIYFSVNGSDRKITFHLGLGFAFWISFYGFIPEKWFPVEKNSYAPKGYLHSGRRQLGLHIHDWALWWTVWKDDNEWSSTTPKWRQGSWHPIRDFKGKHTCTWDVIETEYFVLPFLEGNYSVKVEKKLRTDTWPRWFTRKSVCYEVRPGYEKDGEFISVPVPHEGKGENSWDCGEDGTYSSHFPAKPYSRRLEMRTCYDAALYFWQGAMETRKRYGSVKWMPQKLKRPISIVTENPIS